MPEQHFKGKEYVFNHHLTVPHRLLVAHPDKSVSTEPGDGERASVSITAAAMRDLGQFRELMARARRDTSGSPHVFALGPQRIGQVIQARAKAARLGDGYSGHSGRVGLAQDWTRQGAPVTVLQIQGCWATGRIPTRYAAKVGADQLGQWQVEA